MVIFLQTCANFTINCKENVIKEAKAKFGKETVAEDISSEIFYKITEHSEWFFKLDGTKQKRLCGKN